MAQAGLGSMPLAKEIGKPELQSTIHRFIHGEVASPKRATAEALAAYFKLPVDALYDDKLATRIAIERELSPPARKVPKERAPRPTKPSVARPEKLTPQELELVRAYRELIQQARDLDAELKSFDPRTRGTAYYRAMQALVAYKRELWAEPTGTPADSADSADAPQHAVPPRPAPHRSP